MTAGLTILERLCRTNDHTCIMRGPVPVKLRVRPLLPFTDTHGHLSVAAPMGEIMDEKKIFFLSNVEGYIFLKRQCMRQCIINEKKSSTE